MITVNIDKAKAIAHDVRRAARAEEFKPLDEVIAKQIPNTDVAAVEIERQAVRDKYAAMQAAIDAAVAVDEIKAAMSQQGA
jgi:hypothetical protein